MFFFSLGFIIFVLLGKMESPLRQVVVLRHGRTHYVFGNQKFASPESAPDDLIEEALDTVKESGRAIGKKFIRRILSSPTARCLHTARVARESAGLSSLPIEIEDELREIDGYNRQKFLKCVREAHGDDKKLSDLELSQIFVSDDLHNQRGDKFTKESTDFLVSAFMGFFFFHVEIVGCS